MFITRNVHIELCIHIWFDYFSDLICIEFYPIFCSYLTFIFPSGSFRINRSNYIVFCRMRKYFKLNWWKMDSKTNRTMNFTSAIAMKQWTKNISNLYHSEQFMCALLTTIHTAYCIVHTSLNIKYEIETYRIEFAHLALNYEILLLL